MQIICSRHNIIKFTAKQYPRPVMLQIERDWPPHTMLARWDFISLIQAYGVMRVHRLESVWQRLPRLNGQSDAWSLGILRLTTDGKCSCLLLSSGSSL